MHKQYFFLFLFGFAQLLSAQSDLKIGQWRSHLPYQFGRYITQSPDRVYYTTDWAVLSMDKTDYSEVDFVEPQYLSKVDGLSDVGTVFVKYYPPKDALLVTYSNSIFDLVLPDGVTTFANIQSDGPFFNRTINDVYLASNNKMYFSTGFGVVEFDVENEEFGFTANLDVDVLGIALYKDRFYATTLEGVYTAINSPSVNLKDISNWSILDESAGFPAIYESGPIVGFGDYLYLSIDDTLFAYDGSQLEKVYQDDTFFISFLSAEGAHLLVGVDCSGECMGKVLLLDENNAIQEAGNSCANHPLYAIETPTGQLWFADQWRDVRVANGPNESCSKFKFNSPFTESAQDIVVDDNKVYVATEPTLVDPVFRSDGFFELSEGDWTAYNTRSVDVFKPDNMIAFHRVLVNPINKKVYAGTFWNGLVEFDGGSFVIYDRDNSALQASTGDPSRVRIGGMDFDQDNNLWISNHTSARPIVVYTATGEWFNDFPRASSGQPLRQMVVDDSGFKWFAIDKGGVLVYDSGVLEDPSDDEARIINSSNSQLPNNNVNCLAVDLDGDVWVGTTEGTVVFECGNNVLDPNCQGSRRIVEVGGFNAFLLEDENIRTIAVDGANRKWFGSESGVFVQSPSGEEQITFFNKENSPLFDNVINDIAINSLNGEVFIGTAKGLISVRSDAIGGGVVHQSSVYAYPNPVRPDYDGPIAITGLARDADVKITDVSGQLVFETTALGGQAIWDGRDYNGRKASSGVYLVYATSTRNSDNPDTAVTKILFMN
ncbi:MAG: two-component regulator propeller domain-containing protein [Bacteroidota bacterium]